ncbi:hypothetical protein D3C80_1586540 [compost metagenome]
MERISLAIPIHRNAVIMSEKVNVLYFGTAVTKAMTIISIGRIMKKSTRRMNRLSIMPPKYPETSPTVIPIAPVIRVTIIPILSELRVPIISCPNTSRPP